MVHESKDPDPSRWQAVFCIGNTDKLLIVIEYPLDFDVQGYSDKQKVLLTKIMDKLTSFQVRNVCYFICCAYLLMLFHHI